MNKIFLLAIWLIRFVSSIFNACIDRWSIRSSQRDALNLSILDAGILKMVQFFRSKIDDVPIEHGRLPHILPLAVLLKFCCGQVEGIILNIY